MILIVILGVLVIGGLILTAAFCKDLWLLVKTHMPRWGWLLVIVLGVAVIQELRPSAKAKDSLGLYEYRISDKWMKKGEFRISCRNGKVTRVISSERLSSRQIKEVLREIRRDYPNETLIFFLTSEHKNYDDLYAEAYLRDSIIIMNPYSDQRDTITFE